MKPLLIISLAGFLILLAACDQSGDAELIQPSFPVIEEVSTLTQSEANVVQETFRPVVQEELSATDQPKGMEGPASTSPPLVTATTPPDPTEPAVTPIEVTYFTPGQGEGPYYPLEKPADRDNDLTLVEGAAGVPSGEVIEFSGKIYDATGYPIEGVLIEIWQTDANGIYLHPGDPDTEQRDPNFQFYGEAITAADGGYSFRTILPGHYEPRPRHIHVKVKLGDRELLTTQFYFEGDPDLAGEAMFSQAGGAGQQLIISLTEGGDANGNAIFIGERDIILSVELSG